MGVRGQSRRFFLAGSRAWHVNPGLTRPGGTFEQTPINRPSEPCPVSGCAEWHRALGFIRQGGCQLVGQGSVAAAVVGHIRHRGTSIININYHHNDSAPVSTALILAAGSGSRLNPLTNDVPKCLTEIDGIPILEHQIACLCRWGFKKLIVVVGHLEDSIRCFLDGLGTGIDIEYVSNPRFKTTNNNYSLWLARKRLLEPFLLLECDLVFDASLLEGMLRPDAIAVSPRRSWMSGTMVELDGLHGIKRFKVAGCADIGGLSHKTVNIYSLSAKTWRLVEQGLHGMVMAGRVNEFYENVFAELVSKGSLSFRPVIFGPGCWREIDTVADLREAEQVLHRVTLDHHSPRYPDVSPRFLTSLAYSTA